MSFYPEFDGLSLVDLENRFDGPVPADDSGYEDNYYGEVALRLAESGPEGRKFLWSRRHLADEPRVRAVVFALAHNKLPDEAEFDDYLLASLSDRRPGVVAEAVDGLRKRNNREAWAHVIRLLDHYSAIVRGSVLRYIRAIDPAGSRKLLANGLSDPDPIVRQNAVDELAALGDSSALPLIRVLLKDSDEDVRQAARSAVAELNLLE